MSLKHDDVDQTVEDREQQIANYLIAHPDYFQRHPDALAAIDIPHPTGDAVSLIKDRCGPCAIRQAITAASSRTW